MAKKAYIGVNGVARSAKKGYVGVNGIAKKIKKAYVGIGGMARPCWSGGEVTYYGLITPLSADKEHLTAQTIGNYALFVGGSYQAAPDEDYLSFPYGTVDTYNRSLTRGNAQNMGQPTYDMKTTTVGNYALFIGGYTQFNNNPQGHVYSKIETYDAALTRGGAPRTEQYMPVCATTGEYAIFIGGHIPNASDWSYRAQALSSSMVQTNLPDIDTKIVGGGGGGGGTLNGYALLFGSSGSAYDGNLRIGVYCYNSALTRTKVPYNQWDIMDCATSTPNHVIFYSQQGRACAFDKSFTQFTIPFAVGTQLTSASTSIGEYALIAGNYNTKEVLIYDASLTACPTKYLRDKRMGMAATSIGDFALFGGGRIANTSSINGVSTVEAFTL